MLVQQCITGSVWRFPAGTHFLPSQTAVVDISADITLCSGYLRAVQSYAQARSEQLNQSGFCYSSGQLMRRDLTEIYQLKITWENVRSAIFSINTNVVAIFFLKNDTLCHTRDTIFKACMIFIESKDDNISKWPIWYEIALFLFDWLISPKSLKSPFSMCWTQFIWNLIQ